MTIAQLLSAAHRRPYRRDGDRLYVTSCTGCGFITTLNEMRLVQWGESSRYLCPLCGHIAVAIEPAPDGQLDTPPGVRIGGYIIDARADITTSFAGGPPAVAGKRPRAEH